MITPTFTPERIAELTAALDNGSYRDVTERVMRAGELRALLASAGRLVEAERRLRESSSRMRAATISLHSLAALNDFADGIDAFLSPATATEHSATTRESARDGIALDIIAAAKRTR